MNIQYDFYNPEEIIPVSGFLKNKKLSKYFNRETSAAITAVSKLLTDIKYSETMPFYYATGWIEYEDYGLELIAEGSLGDDKKFSNKNFIKNGLSKISPLNQFKILQNMPLAFISIEKNLRGDNSVVYSSASSLLVNALYSINNNGILIGAGKVYSDGCAASGFAIISKSEIQNSKFIDSECEAIQMFREWNNAGCVI